MSSAAGGAFWRAAGFTYNRYLNIASQALRSMVKANVRNQKKLELRDKVGTHYKLWANGKKTEAGESSMPVDKAVEKAGK